MGNYEKPAILANEDIAEGVYASSGASFDVDDGEDEADCWSVDAYSVQDWNGSHHVFEVRAVHSNSVVHISSATTVTLTFSSPVEDAYSEFACTHSGTTVTIYRALLADAYNSGDSVTYKVWVKADTEAATKAIECIGSSISCTKTVNVQGGFD